MILVILYAVITIASVVIALRYKRFVMLTVPVASLFVYIIVKIFMVPLPFWETVQFIVGLR